MPAPYPAQEVPRHSLKDMKMGLRFFVLVLGVLVGLVGIASGQADQGTITGVIQDQSGAAIGDASVTLSNLDTGQVLKTRTNGSGVYFFLRSRSATTA